MTLEQKVDERVKAAKDSVCNTLINLTYDVNIMVEEADGDLAQAEFLLREVILTYDVQLEEGLSNRILAFIHRNE
jgi:hypothetical protein